MLLRALGHVERGFYIDIGARSPDADSVTRLFYDRGWRGLSIEPHPYFLQQLEKERPEDINLGLVVTRTEGTSTFYKVGRTGLSSTHPEIAQLHEAAGHSIQKLEVPATTLRELWTKYVPDGQPVHFLKIDVEGDEANVISGSDWQNHRPWIVVIEATVPNSQVPNHTEWENHLLAADYSPVYWDGLNRFYLAKEHEELAEAFSAPPNVFDGFKLYSQLLFERQASALAEEARELREKADLMQDEIEKLRITVWRETKARAEAQREMRYLSRPLWRQILFHVGGTPRHYLKRSLFHKSGKPRGVFRNLVLQKDGKPRDLFFYWMTGPEYQALPGAVKFIHQEEDGGVPYEQMSARTRYFYERLSQENHFNLDT